MGDLMARREQLAIYKWGCRTMFFPSCEAPFILRLIPGHEVDDVFQGITGQVPFEIIRGDADDIVVRRLEMIAAGDVRRDVDARRLPQGIRRRQRFRVSNV